VNGKIKNNSFLLFCIFGNNLYFGGFMRNLFLVVFTFIFGFTLLIGQDDLNNVQFEESDVKIEKPPYFGIGGGYVGNFIFYNLDDVNNLIKAIPVGLDEIKSPIFLSGAQGFTAIGIIKNLRIGFSGFSGSKTTEKEVNFSTKGVKYEVSYTSFAIDYGIVPLKSLAILPGINFGWSNVNISKYSISQIDWNDLKSENYNSIILTGSFWFVQPGINVEFAATPFLMIRVGAAYPISFSPKWKIDDVKEITNVPSGIKPSGFNFNFGIFVGLFNY
jgi:hypothetical protein